MSSLRRRINLVAAVTAGTLQTEGDRMLYTAHVANRPVHETLTEPMGLEDVVNYVCGRGDRAEGAVRAGIKTVTLTRPKRFAGGHSGVPIIVEAVEA